MDKFIHNITHAFGDKGTAWLSHLPQIVKKLCLYWDLTHLTPVENMSYNYVAKAMYQGNQPVVLKICCEKKLMLSEAQSLTFFNGQGAIKLIHYHEPCHALLLQRAVPGLSLKSLFPQKSEFVLGAYVRTMRQLHEQKQRPQYSFLHMTEWLKTFDNKYVSQIPNDLLQYTIDIKDKLLASLKSSILLHGDLHHDNVLQHEHTWLAIDPKGIMGEPEFELAAFDFIDTSEIEKGLDIKKLFEKRLELVAQMAQLNIDRIRAWVLVRLILSLLWSIEDGDDSSYKLNLATRLFPVGAINL